MLIIKFDNFFQAYTQNITGHGGGFCTCDTCLATLIRAVTADITLLAEQQPHDRAHHLIGALALEMAVMKFDADDAAAVHQDLAAAFQQYKTSFAKMDAAQKPKRRH